MKLILIVTTFFAFLFESNIKNEEINYNFLDTQISASVESFKTNYKKYRKLNYFKNESVKQIAKKLNKYLNSTLKGKGEYIARYSIKVGMDPYLATAVMLQETGCYWTCSYLTRVCNNVGGNKGKPGCNGGSYRKFDSIEIGIKFAINKLNSYYSKGITTPKEIGPKYASDPLWATRVNRYIKKLKKA